MNNEEHKNLEKRDNYLEENLKEILYAYNEIDNILNNTINNGKGIWDGTSAKEYLERWNKTKIDIPDIVKILENEREEFDHYIQKLNDKN